MKLDPQRLTLDTVFVRRAPIAPLGSRCRDALLPADDESAERIAKIPLAEVAEIRIVRARSVKQMRLYRAAVKRIAEAIGETPDYLHAWTKCRLGYYEKIELPRGSGKYIINTESCAFNEMSQDRWQAFLDQAKELWFSEIIPRAEGEALFREISEMLGIPPDPPAANGSATGGGRPGALPQTANPGAGAAITQGGNDE